MHSVQRRRLKPIPTSAQTNHTSARLRVSHYPFDLIAHAKKQRNALQTSAPDVRRVRDLNADHYSILPHRSILVSGALALLSNASAQYFPVVGVVRDEMANRKTQVNSPQPAPHHSHRSSGGQSEERCMHLIRVFYFLAQNVCTPLRLGGWAKTLSSSLA